MQESGYKVRNQMWEVLLMSDRSPLGMSQLGTLIDEHDIRFMSSVPSFWKMVCKLSKPPQKNSLERVHVGSAPLQCRRAVR